MKKLLILILGLGVGIFVLKQGISNFKSPPTITSNSTTPTASSVAQVVPYPVSINNINYAVYVTKISNPRGVTLIPNFTEKNTAAAIFTKEKCDVLINGGFYTTDEKPLGLFFVGGTFLETNKKTSDILSGFVYKTKGGSLGFGTSLPNASTLEFAFQTGPYFSQNQNLTVTPDSYDRRALLGTIGSDIYAIMITEEENISSGPYLADMPLLFGQVPLPFTSFINLDGGSASALYTGEGIILGELTSVGSFLCMKAS